MGAPLAAQSADPQGRPSPGFPSGESDEQHRPELLIPADDVPDPEVSVVIPAVNEELTIAEFVAWCHEGLEAAGLRGEILIVDSSTDRTAELALAGGARVLKTPKRGLGRAYIDAIPYIRGRYVVMGDADLHVRLPTVGSLRREAAGRQRVRDGLAMARIDRRRFDARPAPLLRHAGHHLDPQSGLPAVTSPISTAACGRSPSTPSSGWGSRRSRGSTPRRWSSSRCGWSYPPPRCRSPSTRTEKDGSRTTSAPDGSHPSRPPGSTCGPCSSTAPSSSC